MIVLDTNVVSEFFNQTPDPKVKAWISTFSVEDMYVAVPTLMELWSSAARLPEGRRRRELEEKIIYITKKIYIGRILNLDQDSAKIGGQFFAAQFLKGRKPSLADCQIAGIASVFGFAVATRDVDDFRQEGLRVINPWDES
jgi:toxin FitB